MNVDQLVVSDGSELDGMKLARGFRVEPRQKSFHEDVNFLRLWWNVIADIDLRSAKNSSLDGINMAKHPLVNLQDVIDANVVVPKRVKQSLELQSPFISFKCFLT
jgi:hypothetical protein